MADGGMNAYDQAEERRRGVNARAIDMVYVHAYT